MKKEKKYNYFYKITNNINNHFYYGIHSTDNLNDGYMGSGSRLHAAYKKYGIENFSKEILKYFDTREECAQYEAEAVTEQLVLDNNCYNISCGGEYWNTLSSVPVIDISTGDMFRCAKTDAKYISGQYVFNLHNTIAVYDNITHDIISIKNIEYDKNKYTACTANTVVVKDLYNNTYKRIDNTEFVNNTRYQAIAKYKVLTKDKFGNVFFVDKNDERYISGELVHYWKGRIHTQDTKEKIKNTMKQNNHQKGEKNSQYGTCWVYNDFGNKKIKKECLDQYISNGWNKGRKMK